MKKIYDFLPPLSVSQFICTCTVDLCRFLKSRLHCTLHNILCDRVRTATSDEGLIDYKSKLLTILIFQFVLPLILGKCDSF